MTEPCHKRLDAECFKAHPEWAKQAFAYRLLHTIIPKEITRRLPKILAQALIAPGVIIPPGAEVEPGTTVSPGTDYPSDYTSGDPDPSGVSDPATTDPGTDETGGSEPTYIGVYSPGPIRTVYPSPILDVSVSIIAQTSDGYVGRDGSVWGTVHDSLNGEYVNSVATEFGQAIACFNLAGGYDLYRSFLVFDLSTITSGFTCVSCELVIQGFSQAGAKVSVQQSTHTTPLGLNDYKKYSGSYFARTTWNAGECNTLIFNAAGIAYIQSVFGSDAKLCLREYDHDYLDVAPDPGPPYERSGMYFADTPTLAYRPKLNIVYSA